MVRMLAFLVGIAFIFGGLVGYGVMPQFIENGLLFGYFGIDNISSIAYFVTGIAAIMSSTSSKLSKFFFILFGLIYAVAAGLGFWHQGNIYITTLIMANSYLYAGIAIIMLLIGFSSSSRR
jgi:hypothetical protein